MTMHLNTKHPNKKFTMVTIVPAKIIISTVTGNNIQWKSMGTEYLDQLELVECLKDLLIELIHL